MQRHRRLAYRNGSCGALAQALEQQRKINRHGHLPGHGRATRRMPQAETEGMQRLAREGVEQRLAAAALTVHRVAHQGM
ncbi:hypothetical protein RZS08_14760, partial [Arthrospira platensis SPKY1]|nr:hypothetical protein [Arthrospira platensis SPKY1]